MATSLRGRPCAQATVTLSVDRSIRADKLPEATPDWEKRRKSLYATGGQPSLADDAARSVTGSLLSAFRTGLPKGTRSHRPCSPGTDRYAAQRRLTFQPCPRCPASSNRCVRAASPLLRPITHTSDTQADRTRSGRSRRSGPDLVDDDRRRCWSV